MIELRAVSKTYEAAQGPVLAIDNVSLRVEAGEICVLLGPSGCGKTTVLKMVNRLIALSSGSIHVNGQDIASVNAVQLRRSIGYVIQQVGLFPNKTIVDNICTVPDLLGWNRKKSRARAAELLEMVALDPEIYMNRYPKELSGGQQQRVGVIRALAADPPVLLMDEPFGAIDPINRATIQDEFLKLQERFKKTVMFVSHDIDEAVKMADKIALFRGGRLEQFGPPEEVLAHPASSFVADFVGTDRTLKLLGLIQVRDAMLADPPRVLREDDLALAVERMQAHGHTSIVVVGPRGRARGFIHLTEALNRAGTVGEHQSALPATVHVDDDLRTAVSLMFMHGVTWLAAVDEDGFFKGYVTQRSVAQRLNATYRD